MRPDVGVLSLGMVDHLSNGSDSQKLLGDAQQRAPPPVSTTTPRRARGAGGGPHALFSQVRYSRPACTMPGALHDQTHLAFPFTWLHVHSSVVSALAALLSLPRCVPPRKDQPSSRMFRSRRNANRARLATPSVSASGVRRPRFWRRSETSYHACARFVWLGRRRALRGWRQRSLLVRLNLMHQRKSNLLTLRDAGADVHNAWQADDFIIDRTCFLMA